MFVLVFSRLLLFHNLRIQQRSCVFSVDFLIIYECKCRNDVHVYIGTLILFYFFFRIIFFSFMLDLWNFSYICGRVKKGMAEDLFMYVLKI